MQTTTHYALQKPDPNDSYNKATDNANMDAIDAQMYANAQASSQAETDLTTHKNDHSNPHQVTAAQVGALAVGAGNGAVDIFPALLFSSDTRSLTLNFTGNQLSSITITDPTNSNATVETITVNYTGSQLTSVVTTASGHTSTATLNYAGGKLSSVSKSYV